MRGVSKVATISTAMTLLLFVPGLVPGAQASVSENARVEVKPAAVLTPAVAPAVAPGVAPGVAKRRISATDTETEVRMKTVLHCEAGVCVTVAVKTALGAAVPVARED